MAIPPFDAEQPFIVERLQTSPDLGNAQVNKGLFYITCRACGFSGADGSFTAWPDQGFLRPSELQAFVAELVKNHRRRKCPDCHEMAKLDGLRIFVMSGALDQDLVIEADGGSGSTTFGLMSPDGTMAPGPVQGDALRTVCLDASLRAGSFIAEVMPEQDLEARRLLTAVVQDREADPDAWVALARLEARTGDPNAALECVTKATPHIDDNPGCAQVAGLLAEIALSRTNADLLADAIGWYERALEMEPGDVVTRLAMARLMVQSGKFEEARSNLEIVERDYEHQLEAGYLLGVLQLHLEENETAAIRFRYLTRRAPEDPAVLQMLAWAEARLGDREAAEAALEQASKLRADPEELEYFTRTVAEELGDANPTPPPPA